MRKFVAHFLQLLLDLLYRSLDVWPVESNTRGAVLKPERSMERRQIGGQAVDDARTLLRLHLLPRLARALTVQMWMPALHLRDERPGHVVHGERALFLGEHGVEENLQQEIAQLFANGPTTKAPVTDGGASD